ncbi:MAG TPA: HAMP domain-containing sensor histidine kinase [Jiangellales bacterium]|nr:HAMP domain-containing sensor histidine kinase [Jiangellales bacterium]
MTHETRELPDAPEAGRASGAVREQPVVAPGDDGRAPGPRGARRVRSARVRILGWQLVLVGLALVGSVLVSRAVLVERVDDRIDRSLVQEASEFTQLATTGRDPATGQPFDDVRRLLRVAIERNVPDRNETMLAVVGGTAYARSPQPVPLRLDLDPELVARFAAAAEPVLGTVRTEEGAVRYAAVPVEVAGQGERGVLVIAMFRDLERAEVDDVTRISILAGLATLAVAAALAWVVAGRVLAPVRLVRAAARDITESDLSRRIPVTGNDDVAELARTFNHMLDRLEVAFATQQDFVNDAGHELRTPITIIRGHLEILEDDPVARRQTLDLVMDELDRMGRMVEDLLTLAKADRPDFLRLGLVDLEPFTDELFDKARALAPRDWRLEHLDAGDVVVDRQRVTQAVVQLVQNATQHTEEGDPIWLGSRIVDGHVSFWVRDSGPGVPPAEREQVFDRFHRGVGSREQATGAGLGLAIVRAIAEAHGGRVRLVDPAAGGAEFRLELPIAPTDRRDHEEDPS